MIRGVDSDLVVSTMNKLNTQFGASDLAATGDNNGHCWQNWEFSVGWGCFKAAR